MILVTERNGQLGNRLQLFAHLIGTASEHKLTIKNPAFLEYGDLFQGTYGDIHCQFPKSKIKIRSNNLTYRILKKRVRLFLKFQKLFGTILINSKETIEAKNSREPIDLDDPYFINLVQKYKILICKGYFFRSHKNVLKNARIIKEYFSPTDEHREKINWIYSAVKAGEDVVICGVHIRQGDYKSYRNGIWFYTLEEYDLIMRKAEVIISKAFNKKVRFLMCSNVQQDSKCFNGLDFYKSSESPIVDLYLLAKCDFIMGPPSSFSRWASFYGDVPLYPIEDIQRNINIKDFTVNSQLVG